MKRNPEDKLDPTTRELVQKARKKERQCLFCPPNRGENASRREKRPVKKPKQKSRRSR